MRLHIGSGDAPTNARARDLGRVQTVLRDEPPHHRRQENAFAARGSAPAIRHTWLRFWRGGRNWLRGGGRSRGRTGSGAGAGCGSGGASVEAGAASAAAPSPLKIAITAPTSTVSPSAATISVSTPDMGDGTSESTLSVDTSKRGSSSATLSPTCLNHWTMVPSITVSPSCGILTSDINPPRLPLPLDLRHQHSSYGLIQLSAGTGR